MGNILIVRPIAIGFGVAAPVVAVSRGAGGANLVKMSPRSVWQDSLNDGSPATLDIDFGGNRMIDTVALIGTNAAAAATWGISSGVSGGGYGDTARLAGGTALRAPTDVADPDLQPVTWPALFKAASPFSCRYLRISLTQPAGAGALQVGCLATGLAFTPGWNFEDEAEGGFIDTGTRTRMPDGGIATVDGVAVPTWDFTFGDLTDEELAALKALVRNRRTTRPVLVVEDPAATAGLAERIRWCLFTQLQKYGRRAASRNRWSLAVEEIL